MHTRAARLFRRLIRPVSWVLGLFAFYLLSVGLALPHILRPALEQRISQGLDSQGRVGSLSLNPLTWTLAATDITLSHPSGATLRLDSLEATPSFPALLQLTPGVRELRLDGLAVDLTLAKDGPFPPPFDDAADRRTPIFPFIIHNLAINNGALTFRDRIRDVTHTVKDLHLTVPFISTLPEDKGVAIAPRLSATVDGHPLRITGEAYPFAGNLRTEFELRTEGLTLDRARNYLAPYTTLDIRNGSLSTLLRLRISRERRGGVSISLAGEAEAADLELAGPQGTAFKAAHIRVTFEDIRPGKIALNEVSLTSPALTARIRADGSADWQQFFPGPAQDNMAPPIVIASKAKIRDGSMTVHDESMPGFSHTIRNIQSQISNFGTSGAADFSLEFGEASSRFTAAGTISPSRIEGAVNMERMPIAPFSRYLAKIAGMLLDGAVDLAGDFAVDYEKRIVHLGGINLRNASATLPGSAAPLFTARQLTANEIMANLSAREITVGRLSGSGLTVSPVRDRNGNFAFAPPTRKNSAPSAGWQVTIGNAQLDSTGITITDHSLRNTAALSFSDVTISASNLSTQLDRQWTADISARPGRHGRLRLEAKGAFNPLALSFRVKADRADLAFLSPYLRGAVPLSLSAGMLNANVNGSLRSGGGDGMSFEMSGDAGLHGVSLTKERREIIGWGRLRAEKFRYRSMPRSLGALHVERLILNGPRVAVTIGEDGVSNIQRAMLPSPKDSALEPPDAPGFSSLSVGGGRVTNGEIRLRDEHMQPPHYLSAANLRLDVGTLSSNPNSRGELAGSFRLNGSPITFDGAINPLAAPFAGELTIDVTDLDLAAFSRYATRLIGHPIHSGELSARIEASLDGMNIHGHSDLVISMFDVGDRDPSSDAPDIPIRAAIGLLRDLSGDIRLSLPVSGRLDDPQFRMSGVISKAVANSMIKAVTTPVRLLGGIFSLFAGTTREERIHFAPGEDRLSGKASNSLRALIEGLPRRGRAKLELIGVACFLEKTDMVTAEIMRKMRKMKHEALPEDQKAAMTPDRVRVGLHVDAKEYARLLHEVYMAWPEKPEGSAPKSAREMLRALRRGTSVSDGQLHELAEARARAVRDEITKIDASLDSRITIGSPRIMSDKDEGRRIDSSVLINIR